MRNTPLSCCSFHRLYLRDAIFSQVKAPEEQGARRTESTLSVVRRGQRRDRAKGASLESRELAASSASSDRSPFTSVTCPEIASSLNRSTTYVNPLLEVST